MSFLFKDCPTVQAGDVIGLYFPITPGPVGYTFSSPSTQTHVVAGNTSLEIGQEVSPQALKFPQQFSFMAFIDTGEFADDKIDLQEGGFS